MSTYSSSSIVRDIAASVARESQAAKAGVVVDVQWHQDGLRFVIWSISKNRGLVDHRLDADQTTRERLLAHVNGFIDNHLADWKTTRTEVGIA